MGASGIPLSELFLIGTITLETLGGLSIMFGYRARIAAAALFLFLIPVTVLFHPFWNADSASYQNQLNHFLKNLAIMGGMLYIALSGPGKYSLSFKTER